MSQQGSGENEMLSATPCSGKASTRVESVGILSLI